MGNDREDALKRLRDASGNISDLTTLKKLAREAEILAEREASLEKARELAKQPHRQRADNETVTYDDALSFGQAVGISQQRMSRFWTSLLKGGRRLGGSDRDHYQAAEVTMATLRQKLADPFSSISEAEREILEAWLLNL